MQKDVLCRKRDEGKVRLTSSGSEDRRVRLPFIPCFVQHGDATYCCFADGRWKAGFRAYGA